MIEEGDRADLYPLVGEILYTYFKLRAVGTKIGAVGSGGGVWGMLRSLYAEGPKTVPEIARSRPVARQHIQTLANDLAADGLIEFIENPKHKRSKLVSLTNSGRAHFEDVDGRIRDWLEKLDLDISAEECATAVKVISRLREKIEESLEQPIEE